MSGSTSTQPAIAHSRRTMSVSLLTASGCATVLVAGKVSGSLLNPYAIAASSMMSHSCKMSGRVGGMSTMISSGLFGETCGCSVMRSRRVEIAAASSSRPVQELMYDARAVAGR